MSERKKPHNGRDVDGNRRIVETDVDDLVIDPAGSDYLREDVRHGGAVADTGPAAGQRGTHIHELVEENRENVKKIAKA
jgi:hypothetical protein